MASIDRSQIPLQFKDWTIPGVIPPGRLADIQAGPGESLDAISGHFKLFQLKDGHRFSTDDLLVAWYGSSWCPSASKVLDLGSGIGTVATIVAWRLPGAVLTTIEAQEISVDLARKSAGYNGLSSRISIRSGDFRTPGILGPEETFDLILGSPPYFPVSDGLPGDHPQKVACRFELRGDVGDYCAVASRHLAPGGILSLVFPFSDPQRHRLIEGASRSQLSLIRERPVIFREGDAPLVGVFVLMRSADLPPAQRNQTWREPPLVIRTQTGEIHPEYSAIKLSIGFPP
ncbi:MAG: methyltransferase [Verrucomicrobia bacterium]|nr:methyltransferase [Verrucomicrobiota bacterium]